MSDQLAREINPLLSAFLAANEESASERLLVELIDERIDPIVKKIIRAKLHASLQITDERQINQDALDLVSEVRTLVVAKLSSLKLGVCGGSIESMEAYVKTIAANACNQYLRKKYPGRLRLKNQLRYLLSHDRRFLEWQLETGDWVCGLSEWGTENPEHTNIEGIGSRAAELKQKLEKDDFSAERSNIVDLVIAVFKHCQTPLRFVDLVSTVYELRGIKEPTEVPEDEAATSYKLKSENDIEIKLEQTEFLNSLWDEIGQLPLRHRAALLLNLKNSEGDGLITLLPLTRIASIRQIAEMLEFPIEEFVGVWNELPWDDMAIAEYLKLERQQVINLRQSARATLRRRLNYF